MHRFVRMGYLPCLGYLLSTLLLVWLLLGYGQYGYFAGGPDGYQSDYDAQMQTLYGLFALPGLALMLAGLWLGWRARYHKVLPWLATAWGAGLVLVLLWAGLDLHYYALLDHGQGG